MSAARVKIEGFEEIQEALNKLGNGKNVMVNKALKKSIEVLHAEIVARTPVDEENTGEHLKDDIVMSDVIDEEGVLSIYTGVKKTENSRRFYAMFVEFGTKKMRARPFIQPSYNAKKNKAFTVMCKSLKEDLGL